MVFMSATVVLTGMVLGGAVVVLWRMVFMSVTAMLIRTVILVGRSWVAWKVVGSAVMLLPWLPVPLLEWRVHGTARVH